MGELPDLQQDESFATKAPMIRRSLKLTEDAAHATTSNNTALVVTVMGADRPGIVSLLSDRAHRFGASWADSRMARLAGEFAGMVQLDVPTENADALVAALKDLESTGLRVVITKSEGRAAATGLRLMTLELLGGDRAGIVSNRNISIEHLHTEVVTAQASAGNKPMFKVRAEVLVPQSVSTEALKLDLDALAHEMTLDIALGD
jgi:methionyl-tRNA formyltransferase